MRHLPTLLLSLATACSPAAPDTQAATPSVGDSASASDSHTIDSDFDSNTRATETENTSSLPTHTDTDADTHTHTHSDADTDTFHHSLDAATVFHVGHSLVNHNMPRIFEQVALDAGRTHSYDVQIINGASLQYQWNNSHGAEGRDARVELLSGIYDVLVITEAVPLDNHLTWSDTEIYAGHFYELAIESNPGSRVYLYETWHCLNSGTPTGCDWDDGDDVPWRARLDSDHERWQGIVDDVNALSSGPEMRLIPAGQAMAELYDRIEAGEIPELSDIQELFTDDIHLTDVGNYFVAMVHYATIYRRSPIGLTRETSDPWGAPYTAPSPALAATLQEIAWDVVSRDPSYGVRRE
ncbi:MAG: hypothetical protein EA397_13150 [Deltaproteobacteria bacterium]|nr:MAG: hypothetical protein EA397_13150 [Deltaproteobacteria bacterium]